VALSEMISGGAFLRRFIHVICLFGMVQLGLTLIA